MRGGRRWGGLEGYEVVEVLERLLEKDPLKRISLHDLKVARPSHLQENLLTAVFGS